MSPERNSILSVGIRGFPSHDDLIAGLVSSPEALGEGFCLVCKSIPLGQDRRIDLLGVDRSGDPVLVVASLGPSEPSLLEVLDLAAWAEDAEALLRSLIPGSRGDGRGKPRILFLAGDFSQRLLRLSSLLRRERIELVLYRPVSLGTESGLLLENLSTAEAGAARCPSASPLSARQTLAADARLTMQEIEELSRPLRSAGG